MNNINNFARNMGVSPRLKNIAKVDGNTTDVNDVYQADFSDEIALIVRTKKNDKNIIDLLLLSTPKSTTGPYDLLTAYGCLVAVLNPEFGASANANERGKFITELILASPGKLNSKKTVTRGNIRYTFSASEATGIMLTAANRQD